MYGIFVSPKPEVLRAASASDRDMFIGRGWRELTQDEITAAGMVGYEQYVSPLTATVSPDGNAKFTPPDVSEISFQRMSTLRTARDARLTATDKYMLPDYPISADNMAAVKAYRQALRDLPAQPGAPWDGGGTETPWPELPKT